MIKCALQNYGSMLKECTLQDNVNMHLQLLIISPEMTHNFSGFGNLFTFYCCRIKIHLGMKTLANVYFYHPKY